MGKKSVITVENNKIEVSREISLSITPGEYTMENLIKEIEVQARKSYPKATVYCTENGAICMDLIGDQHGQKTIKS